LNPPPTKKNSWVRHCQPHMLLLTAFDFILFVWGCCLLSVHRKCKTKFCICLFTAAALRYCGHGIFYIILFA